MERSAYTVMESVGQVEVCVVVSGQQTTCPVGYNISLILPVLPQTAGNIEGIMTILEVH